MIYFIRSGEFVKIGVANNPWARLYDFQVASPVKLDLLAVAPGDYEDEARYHAEFAYCRTKGEWFVHDELIAVTVANIKSYYPDYQSPSILKKNHKRINPKASINAADAVRLVVNTAVAMKDNEPVISVRSVTELKRGPGILIWIPGYVSNGETIIEAPTAPQEEPTKFVDPA